MRRIVPVTAAAVAAVATSAGLALATGSYDTEGGYGASPQAQAQYGASGAAGASNAAQTEPTAAQATATPAPAKASGHRFMGSRLATTAYLTGAPEVDENGLDAGDADGKGTATFLQTDERTVCYGFALQRTDAPTAVHIHRGAPGTNGPPVIEFKNVPKDDAGAAAGNPGASSGCKVTSGEETVALRRIRQNPRNYYVNFHTAAFPNGAVRGQLARLQFANR